MFIKEHGTAAILLAAVFMSLGFILGKVTSRHGGHRGCKSATSCNHSKCTPPPPGKSCDKFIHSEHGNVAHWVEEGGNHMVFVESMMEAGFEGDTVLTIPGGEIHLTIDGEEVEVQVEVEIEDNEHADHEEVKIVKVISSGKD
jgi:hypothetical protein